MNQTQDLKVLWLLPVTWFYWQPMLSEFSKIFPETNVFTALFPGYAQGYEDSLKLEIIGNFKVFRRQKKVFKHKAPPGFTFISPKIIVKLFQFHPQLIITSSFGLWTLLALLLKPFGRWKVIIAYEGSSPRVDFLYSPVRIWIRKFMVKVADAYITNTNKGKTYLINTLLADPARVFAKPYEIPSTISLLENQNKNKKIEKISLKKPIFLFVGRIMPRKGLDLLLQASLILKQQGCDNYSLLVVGDGEQRQELEFFCHNQGLDSIVRWIGTVDYQEINTYFKTADVFVFPTLEDTWGVVTLEAMLFGKPVLCSKGAGSSELIVDEENGYVFDPQQSNKLAELMSKFIENPQLVKTMGEKSQELISAHTPKAASKFLAGVVDFINQ